MLPPCSGWSPCTEDSSSASSEEMQISPSHDPYDPPLKQNGQTIRSKRPTSSSVPVSSMSPSENFTTERPSHIRGSKSSQKVLKSKNFKQGSTTVRVYQMNAYRTSHPTNRYDSLSPSPCRRRESPSYTQEPGHAFPHAKKLERSQSPSQTLSDSSPKMENMPTSSLKHVRQVKGTGMHFEALESLNVSVSVEHGELSHIPPPLMDLQAIEVVLGINIYNSLKNQGIERLTPIQKYAIPAISAGHDILASAQTGSGKTLAFLCPSIASILKFGQVYRPYFVGPHAQISPLILILCPTRELALQIHEQVEILINETTLTSCVLYGGETTAEQVATINKQQADIVIATPGRLVDLIDACKISLGFVKCLVFDEADIMLSMGFEEQIRSLVFERDLSPKESRQTLLFTATYPTNLKELLSSFMRCPFIRISMGNPNRTTSEIQQIIKYVEENDKKAELLADLRQYTGKAIIFVAHRNTIYFLLNSIRQFGHSAEPLHGKMDQISRQEIFLSFRKDEFRILIATSVAARGLDFPDVTLVINYDMPSAFDQYMHRIGRTGRIGNQGVALSYFCRKDRGLASRLEEQLQRDRQPIPSWLRDFNYRSHRHKSIRKGGSSHSIWKLKENIATSHSKDSKIYRGSDSNQLYSRSNGLKRSKWPRASPSRELPIQTRSYRSQMFA